MSRPPHLDYSLSKLLVSFDSSPTIVHPVQELTLQAKDAAAGSVRNYTAPTPPQAPALPTDLAGELSKFDAEEPTIGQSSAAPKAAATEDAGEGAQEFLNFLEKDIPKDDAHH